MKAKVLLIHMFQLELNIIMYVLLLMSQAYSPVNIQMDPPQIATEGFSSDSLSERSPEQHTKNRGKSRHANIIFFGKIQNGSQKHNFVYYSVILNTKM